MHRESFCCWFTPDNVAWGKCTIRFLYSVFSFVFLLASLLRFHLLHYYIFTFINATTTLGGVVCNIIYSAFVSLLSKNFFLLFFLALSLFTRLIIT